MKKKEIKKLKKSIIANSFWTLATSLTSRIGALVFTIILARYLMPEGYGLYSIVLSTAMIFYIFTDLGINNSFVRYISFALSRDKKNISTYYLYLSKIKLFLVLIISGLLLVFAYPISFFVFRNPLILIPLLVAAFYIFFMSLEAFYNRIFYSVEKVKYTTLRELLNQGLKIIFALIIFYIVASAYRITAIFLSMIVISALLLFLNKLYIKKFIPQLRSKSPGKIDKKKVRKFIGFMTLASISTVFFSYIDSIMLAIYLSPEYVGYYRAAFSLVLGITGIVGIPSVALFPFFTKMKSKIANKKLFNKAFRYISIISIPSIFALIILGRFFIRLFYGYEYLSATLPLYALSFIVFFSVCVALFVSFFSARGKPQLFAKLILLTSILNILLNFILISLFLYFYSPEMAILGAAIATTASWAFYFVAILKISKKEFDIGIPFVPVVKSVASSLVMSGVIILFLSRLNEINFLSGIVLTLAGVISYLIAMIILGGITREDLDIISSFRKISEPLPTPRKSRTL
jgi:O-antigen/teichoic acid export membrane protein